MNELCTYATQTAEFGFFPLSGIGSDYEDSL